MLLLPDDLFLVDVVERSPSFIRKTLMRDLRANLCSGASDLDRLNNLNGALPPFYLRAH
jgi:hypothetical protein